MLSIIKNHTLVLIFVSKMTFLIVCDDVCPGTTEIFKENYVETKHNIEVKHNIKLDSIL